MSTPSIVDANLAAHAHFIALCEEALVAFTALDCEGAARAWTALARSVGAHQVVEEELLEAARDFAEAPRGGASSLVIAEHRQLDRLHSVAAHTIAMVSATERGAQRLTMVRGLDDLLRFRHLLEHHGTREERIVYPHLATVLPAELCQRFAARIDAAMSNTA